MLLQNYVDIKQSSLAMGRMLFEQSGSFPKMQFVANGIDTLGYSNWIKSCILEWSFARRHELVLIDNILTLTFLFLAGNQ
jgi:hypothetical protein